MPAWLQWQAGRGSEMGHRWNLETIGISWWHLGVSINGGSSKWLDCNGKSHQNGWFGGTHIYGKPHISWRTENDSEIGHIFNRVWLLRCAPQRSPTWESGEGTVMFCGMQPIQKPSMKVSSGDLEVSTWLDLLWSSVTGSETGCWLLQVTLSVIAGMYCPCFLWVQERSQIMSSLAQRGLQDGSGLWRL